MAEERPVLAKRKPDNNSISEEVKDEPTKKVVVESSKAEAKAKPAKPRKIEDFRFSNEKQVRKFFEKFRKDFLPERCPVEFANDIIMGKRVVLRLDQVIKVDQIPDDPELQPSKIWGYVKDKVYAETFHSMAELKEVIKRVIGEVKANPELVRRVTQSVSGRIQECIDADGGHFEHMK